MKYQIYLSKDVSDIINAIAKFENIKPNTLIKNLMEQNITSAYQQLKTLESEKELKKGRDNKSL